MNSKMIAGIDEAGLGPLLGPLCVGFSCFRGPEKESLWDTLSAIVAPGPEKSQRLIVADSKQVFQGPRGMTRLEETVLSFYYVLHGEIPRTVMSFLDRSPLRTHPGVIKRHPWYKRDGRLPRTASRSKIQDCGEILRDVLKKNGWSMTSAGYRPVPEGELNDSFRNTGNKSLTHFEKCGEVLHHLVHGPLRKGGTVWVDHLGMRQRYLPLLGILLPGNPIWILLESRAKSVYRMENGAGSIEVVFEVKGDEKHFPTALASLFAKYTREVLMESWNRYFAEIAPEVAPTAGYYSDARRYLRQAGGRIREAGIPDHLLLRER